MILSLLEYQSGIYALPHSRTAPNEADNSELIQSFIDRYERELLMESLEVELYNDIKANESDFNAAPDNVKNLVKGQQYELNGKTYLWNGLEGKESLLIPYVYFRYLQDQQDTMTSFGVERPEGVNSDAVSSIPRATKAYRDFFSKYQGVDDYYPRLIQTRYLKGIDYSGSNSPIRSLYQFLCDFPEVYDVSSFRLLDNMNSFGI